MLKDGYSLLLPEGFTDYFDILSVDEKEREIIIFLEEKLVLKEQQDRSDHLESKGFYPAVLVQDFPLRGKPLLLNIRRRRWIDKQTGEYVKRKIHITADGTRLTQEFASFLKGLHR